MTDNFITKTIHNVESLLAGKSTFNDVEADEFKMIGDGISSLAAPLQPAAQILFTSLREGVSLLVGAGQTALGPILAETSDEQSTQVLNMLSAMGVPMPRPGTPLGVAEQAALVTGINGLKAFLDRIGLHIMTVSATAPAAKQAEPDPQ